MTAEMATILNVDDQEPGRYARRRMLERAGYRVIDANCGVDAWRVLENVRPQLVLMDVNLPDISGFDLCRRIKSRPELADIMVLHVSASRVSGTDRAVGLEVGSDGYLIEPIDEKELHAAVRSLLRLRERQQENEGLLARLRRSEELFRGLFEQAAVGMCVVGSDGRLLRVNDKLCSITGRAEHDLMKQELRDLTHPDDRAEHESQVGTLLLGGISEVSLEQRLMRPDGDTIWVTVTLSIQWDAGGRIQSLIGVIEDIDAHKRAELELRTHTARQQLLSKTMDQLLRVDDPADVMQDIYASLRTSVGLDTFWIMTLRRTTVEFACLPGRVFPKRRSNLDVSQIRTGALRYVGRVAEAGDRRALAVLDRSQSVPNASRRLHGLRLLPADRRRSASRHAGLRQQPPPSVRSRRPGTAGGRLQLCGHGEGAPAPAS